MIAHTPGPWRTAVVGGFHDNKLVASAWIEAGEYHSLATLIPVKEVEANARLMAAAPDLLIACKMALNDRLYREWPAIAESLAAAIAKAEGEL